MREKYQRQGYMRKVLDIAFAEGDRLGVPVILAVQLLLAAAITLYWNFLR